MSNYFRHMIMNFKVAKHALFDFWVHFIHGLIPYIKIKHNCEESEREGN